MKGRPDDDASLVLSPVRGSVETSGTGATVRHAGKQLTCTFSLVEQLVGQSTTGQEPSAFLIPGVPSTEQATQPRLGLLRARDS